jgi:hypothetical protein
MYLPKKEDLKSVRSQNSNDPKAGIGSSFLREKLEKQLESQQKKKAEGKKLTRIGITKVVKKEPAEKTGAGPTDEVLFSKGNLIK